MNIKMSVVKGTCVHHVSVGFNHGYWNPAGHGLSLTALFYMETDKSSASSDGFFLPHENTEYTHFTYKLQDAQEEYCRELK